MNDVIAFLDELLERRVRRLRPERAAGAGRRPRSRASSPGSRRTSSCSSGRPTPGAQLVLCHHGLFWDFHPRAIAPAMKERLRILFEADIVARRLPPAARRAPRGRQQRADLRGARARARPSPSASTRAAPIGFVGRSAEGIAVRRAARALRAAFGQEPFAWDCGPELVRSVGDRLGRRRGVSFARGDRAGTRRVPHRRARRARDGGRARERRPFHRRRATTRPRRFGVRRLGELLAERFGVEHRFVEVPNPI